MPTTYTPISLGQRRIARACAHPTTAGDPWATRHGMNTAQAPGLRQTTEAEVIALHDPEITRIRALCIAEGHLAEAIEGLFR